jgi:hypothetical protein
MGVLEDILKALDRVEIWKEVQNTPQRVSALEKRIGALEEKLGGKWPADVCRYCGERGARLNHAIPRPNDQGFMIEDWKCEKCGKTDVRAHKPSTR